MKPRDFSRDMRLVSRLRRFSRERSGSVGNRTHEKRSGSKEVMKEFKGRRKREEEVEEEAGIKKNKKEH